MMSSSLDKLKALTSRLEDKLEQKEKVQPVVSPLKEELKSVEEKPLQKPVAQPEKELKISGETVSDENTMRVKQLYEKLKIFEKSPDFNNIFIYKAMNL